MLSVGVQTWSTDITALRRYWAAAEQLGYDRLTYGDGLWAWTHDGWTMLGALAVETRRVRIGPAVTYAFDASSHHPSWLAQRAATVDRLADGRLDLRLGVGAEDDETRAAWQRHGIPYPPPAERVARLDETIEIVRALWRGGPVSHRGRFFQLHGAPGGAPPLQRPGPPVWIAAMGDAALAVTARRADGWEASYLDPSDFATRWGRLRAMLVAAGREPEQMRRSVEVDVVLSRSAGESAAALDRFCATRRIDARDPLVATALTGDALAVRTAALAYEAAGATDLLLGFADFPATGMLETFAATVAPALRMDPVEVSGR